jgi:hypothetical protein
LVPLLPTKGAKWLPWTENLNFPPIRWPFFDPPPPMRGQFLYPECGQKPTFFDPLPPPHLVHLVIEWPLTINNLLKFSAQGSDCLTPFIGNGKKLKYFLRLSHL